MKRDSTIRDCVAGLGAAPNEQLDFLELLKTTPADELLGRLASLTKQERTILDHIVRGHCNKDICRALDIEITTAKVHASRIFRKLGVKNRVQAAVLQLWALLLLDDGLPSRPNAAPRTRAATSHEKSPSASSPLLQCETQT